MKPQKARLKERTIDLAQKERPGDATLEYWYFPKSRYGNRFRSELTEVLLSSTVTIKE